MQQLGLKHLRLSLSWSRLLPQGRKGTAVSIEAVVFYNSVLDALQAAGECEVEAVCSLVCVEGGLHARTWGPG
jgi:beta-glucosidase/6-phospho-beta-glucosidase/beta-galactosidase